MWQVIGYDHESRCLGTRGFPRRLEAMDHAWAESLARSSYRYVVKEDGRPVVELKDGTERAPRAASTATAPAARGGRPVRARR